MSKSTVRTIVIGLVMIILASGGLGAIAWQTNQQATVLSEQLATLDAERTQQEALKRLVTIADESTADRQTLSERFLARDSESIDFLNLVESIAPRIGITLETSGLSAATVPNSTATWVQVTFEIAGSQNQIDTFLLLLENLPYQTRVGDVTLKQQANDQWQGDVQVLVMIYEYAQ